MEAAAESAASTSVRLPVAPEGARKEYDLGGTIHVGITLALGSRRLLLDHPRRPHDPRMREHAPPKGPTPAN